MKKIATILAMILLLSIAPQLAVGQFEGEIQYTRYAVDEETLEEQANGKMNILFTPDRIMIKNMGEISDVTVMGAAKAGSILVRLDKEDFIIMDGGTNALKLTPRDLQSMSGLMKGFGSAASDTQTKNRYKITETGTKREISGYTAKKFMLMNASNPNNRVDVWMTEMLKINWGMLTGDWMKESNKLLTGGFPYEKLIQKNRLPILIEEYEQDQLLDKMVATEISERSIPAAEVNLPKGVQALTLQQFMMKGLSGN